MANGNPFFSTVNAGLTRFGQGFGTGMLGATPGGQTLLEQRQAEAERERMVAAMDPARRRVLESLMGPANVFAGGPPGENPFAPPAADPLGDVEGPPAPPPPGGEVTPLEPRPRLQGIEMSTTESLRRLPEGLRPPPSVDNTLKSAAARHGVPVNALRALAAQESSFRTDVVGQEAIDLPGQEGDRARGLFQFTPREVRRLQSGDRPEFNPNDPEQAADETARRLRAALDQGKPIDVAMMEHFGGPDPNLHGVRTKRYREQVSEKFAQLEQADPSVPGQTPQVGADTRQLAAQPGQTGPFGTPLAERPQLNTAQAFLQGIAENPEAFTEAFTNPAGIQGITSLLQEGRMQGGAGAQEQTRVIGGDTDVGRGIGLKPGERARVKGTVTPSGEFFPMEVVAQPFGKAEGGPLVTVVDMKTGDRISRRRDDPEVDQKVQEGWVVASDGTALDRLLSIPESTRKELNNIQASTMTYLDTTGDLLELLGENPDINTYMAAGASMFNNLRQEVKAAARAMGTEFDDSIFDVANDPESFTGLGRTNARVRSLITSLAFQRAVAEKGGTGRITNRDIERFKAEIGGSISDPVALAQVLLDSADRAARAFKTRFEVETEAPFEGDLGLQQLPRFTAEDFERRAQEAAGARTDTPGDAEALPEGIPEGAVPDPQGRTTAEGDPVFLAPDGSLWAP